MTERQKPGPKPIEREETPELLGPFLVEFRQGGRWIPPKLDAIQADFVDAKHVADRIRDEIGYCARVRPLFPTDASYITRPEQGGYGRD